MDLQPFFMEFPFFLYNLTYSTYIIPPFSDTIPVLYPFKMQFVLWSFYPTAEGAARHVRRDSQLLGLKEAGKKAGTGIDAWQTAYGLCKSWA